MRAAALWLAAALAASSGACEASSASLGPFCDRPQPLSAAQQDRLLQFAAVVKRELERSGRTAALIARSGLNLDRFGLRYSHAGLSLRANAHGPWAVRQLYYACDEGRPQLFDQGIAGFLAGTDDPARAYVSIVLLPAPEATAAAQAALDSARALRLVGADYSANAYAFGQRYQNCNQWLAELLATAWGGLDDAAAPRAAAQHWLAAQGFDPAPVPVGSHLLMFAGGFMPWIHYDDHPQEDRWALRFRTVVPASLEAFVRERAPGAERIELCHTEQHVLVHRGWSRIAPGCRPAAGDRVIPFDA